MIEAVAHSLDTTAILEYRPGRATDVPVVQLDVSALREILDFEPRRLAQGLADGV